MLFWIFIISLFEAINIKGQKLKTVVLLLAFIHALLLEMS